MSSKGQKESITNPLWSAVRPASLFSDLSAIASARSHSVGPALRKSCTVGELGRSDPFAGDTPHMLDLAVGEIH
jgi:hypothetical protein